MLTKRNPRAGHGMTGGPILMILLAFPLIAPFALPVVLLQFLGFEAPSNPVQIGILLVWTALLAAFWYWMKWSWWIPAIWVTALGLVFLVGRYC
jgi:hypothetical protein